MSIDSLSTWIGIAIGLVSMAAFAWSAVRYVQVRRAEIHQQRFENIQRLVKLYANWSEQGQSVPMPLAPQIAAVFEFRNYPEYRELFSLLLKHHRFNGPHADLINQLVAESIKYIDGRHWWRAV